MRYALDDGLRVEPWPGDTAVCPVCRGPVLAKCGGVVTWHWAHESGNDCDGWSEGISEWHLDWQNAVPEDRREVVMGRHRADAVTAGGWVIEFQHSSIGADDIGARERFYGKMAWLFDARDAVDGDRLLLRWKEGWTRGKPPGAEAGCTFRWKWPRKSIMVCRCPVMLDVGGDMVLSIHQLYFTDPPHSGWGWLIPKDSVKAWMRGSV